MVLTYRNIFAALESLVAEVICALRPLPPIAIVDQPRAAGTVGEMTNEIFLVWAKAADAVS
jgi:hypothetical protein